MREEVALKINLPESRVQVRLFFTKYPVVYIDQRLRPEGCALQTLLFHIFHMFLENFDAKIIEKGKKGIFWFYPQTLATQLVFIQQFCFYVDQRLRIRQN